MAMPHEGNIPLNLRLCSVRPYSTPSLTRLRRHLLPEVWFHWDPQTVSRRGKEALLRSRMDFLLLLPGGVRVVIEIDGKHHYSDTDGCSNPRLYAEMMAGDRALRLVRYEVYRFGAYELCQPNAEEVLIGFYRSLFDRYSLLPAS